MSPQSISTSLAGCTRQTAIVIEDGPERQQTPQEVPDPVVESDTQSGNNDLPHFIVKDEEAADDKSSYREDSSESNDQSEISAVDDVEESDDEDDVLRVSKRLRQRPRTILNYAAIPYGLEDGPVLEGATSVARGENSRLTRSGRRCRVKNGNDRPVKGEPNGVVCETTTTTLAVPDQMSESDSGRKDYPTPLLPNVRTRSMANLKRKRGPTTSTGNGNSLSSIGTTSLTPFPTTEMPDPTEYTETPSRTPLPTRKMPSLTPRTEIPGPTTPSSVSTKKPRVSEPFEQQSELTRSKILQLKVRQLRHSPPANSTFEPKTDTKTAPILESDLDTTPVPNINRSGVNTIERLTQLLATEKAAGRRLQEAYNQLKWEMAEKERTHRPLMEIWEEKRGENSEEDGGVGGGRKGDHSGKRR